MTLFTESIVEDTALAWLKSVGWQATHESDIAPETLGGGRRDYGEAVLAQRLRDALARLKPGLSAETLLAKLIRGEFCVKDAQGFLEEWGL